MPGFKLDKVAGADGQAPTQPSVTLAREPCLYGGGPPKSCTVAKFQMKPKSVAWGTSRALDTRTPQSAPSNTLRELCATTPSSMPVVSSMYLYVCLFVSSLLFCKQTRKDIRAGEIQDKLMLLHVYPLLLPFCPSFFPLGKCPGTSGTSPVPSLHRMLDDFLLMIKSPPPPEFEA